MHVLALEPYYGGSHRAFLDGWRRHSRHEIDLLTLPDSKWQWRMRGSALIMGEQLAGRPAPDVLFASDFVDLAALAGTRRDLLADVPLLAYFHENQLTYPVPAYGERELEFGFTNLTTCLAADRVLFNSRFHRGDFLSAVEELLGRMPDHVPEWAPGRIRERSGVVPVGVDLASIDRQRASARPRTGPLTVLWNHRWEHDKRVDDFFSLVFELAGAGHEFELVATGGRSGHAPPIFGELREKLSGRLRHLGWVQTRAEYCRLLCECDVVVSMAIQEFFGISVVEAVYAGCVPLLPDRLSYPELLEEEWHETCLYGSDEELRRRLTEWMESPVEVRALDPSAQMRRFGWDRVAPQLDREVDALPREAANG